MTQRIDIRDLPTDTYSLLAGVRPRLVQLVNSCRLYPNRRKFLLDTFAALTEALEAQAVSEDEAAEALSDALDDVQSEPAPEPSPEPEKPAAKPRGRRATAKVKKDEVKKDA